ncbi:hypothetical protein ACTJI8_17635 [Microbacterium sp. 22303]|uniref:hypothetical protein n=1 Tax=Microbacterium sp. 22303 TaxID=3453905 RepID=UPI003F873126
MNETKKTMLSRRTIVKGAAWSIPVIAVAAAAPMAAASTRKAAVVCGNVQDGDNGRYVVDQNMVAVTYARVPDIYEVNVHYADGSSISFGTNFGNAPTAGSTSWTVPTDPDKQIAWVQVHTFNTHFQNGACQ